MKQAEILLRARDYLEQLNRYIDPLTGKYLPEKTVFREESVHKDLFFTVQDLNRIIAYDGDWNRVPFTPDPNRRRSVKVKDQPLGIIDMAKLLSRACDTTRSRVITPEQLLRYLLDRGYLQASAGGRKLPTPKGSAAGLRPGESENIHGSSLILDPAAQQLLLDNLDDVADYCRTYSPEKHAKLRTYIAKINRGQESLQNNLQTVRALNQGLHPTDGRSLPPSDPACQERLKTCFGYVARALERSLELGYFSAKQSFFLTREEWESIPVSDEPCALSIFLQQVNARLSDPTAVQSMTPAKMKELLFQEGILVQSPDPAGKKETTVTAKGEALDISLQTSTNKDGLPYEAHFYSKAAQQYMLTLLKQFVKEE